MGSRNIAARRISAVYHRCTLQRCTEQVVPRSVYRTIWDRLILQLRKSKGGEVGMSNSDEVRQEEHDESRDEGDYRIILRNAPLKGGNFKRVLYVSYLLLYHKTESRSGIFEAERTEIAGTPEQLPNPPRNNIQVIFSNKNNCSFRLRHSLFACCSSSPCHL